METYRLEFGKPAKAVTANLRLHWAVKRRMLAPWRTAVRYTWLAHGRPAYPPATIQICFPVADKRRRDPSNLMPTQKALIDELVKCGAWPDDSPEFVTEAMPTLHIGDLVIITITTR